MASVSSSFDQVPVAEAVSARADRRRRIFLRGLLVAGPVLFCATAALIASLLMNPIYAARAEIVFQPLREAEILEEYRATQIVIVSGHAVLGPISESLAVPFDELSRSLSASFPKGGALMHLQYADADPDTAVSALNSILDRYMIVLDDLEAVDQATYRLLVPPILLDDPVRPKPLQALALGLIVGGALSLGVFAMLARSRRSSGEERPMPAPRITHDKVG